MNTTPGGRAFYHVTDRPSAQKIVDRGFADSGTVGAGSTVTLLEYVPRGLSDGVIRIQLTSETASEVLRHAASDPGGGIREFVVPLELLRNADITHLRQH